MFFGHQLILVKEPLITLFGGGHRFVKLKETNQSLCTSKWNWLIKCIDIIDGRISWSCHKLLSISHVVTSGGSWEEILNASVWMESQLEWENI